MLTGDRTSTALAGLPDEGGDDALHCPLCDYDLRGLSEHRCPECGHAFDPAELRRARTERHPWLFEHAERRRVWAFVRTTAVSVVPFVFWRRVSASHAIVGRRLWIWAIVWIVIACLAAAAVVCVDAVNTHQAANSRVYISLARGRPYAYSWSQAFDYALSDRFLSSTVTIAAYVFAWVGITMLAMNVFGQTLQRAGIRAGHLWRLTLYTLPSLLLPTIVVGFAAVVTRTSDVWIPLCVLGLLVLSTIHLAISHLSYLRVRQAIVQAILTQVMTLLALMVLTAAVTGELWSK